VNLVNLAIANLLGLTTRTVDSVRSFVRREDGASLVEYALLLALIAVVAILALVFLGGSVNNTLNKTANAINGA
jgi:pilus assembly protein Flp/PilA